MPMMKVLFDHYATAQDRHGLTIQKLPEGQKWIEARLTNLRRHVEAAVLAKRGKITLLEAHHIALAIDCHMQCIQAKVILKKYHKSLKPLERMELVNRAISAAKSRVQAIVALKLDDELAAGGLYGDDGDDGDDADSEQGSAGVDALYGNTTGDHGQQD